LRRTYLRPIIYRSIPTSSKGLQGVKRKGMREQERREVLDQLSYAVEELKRYLDTRLIPEVGTNIVYALPNATRPEEVAAVAGRIVRLNRVPHPVGPLEFGASDHMARAVLTAMRYDPEIRSVTNIRFHEAILSILDDLMLDVCTFDRSREPPGIKTMDWGVASCCKDGVPDVIYDRGAWGKEAMIRIFGEDPGQVVRTLLAISKRCKEHP
jgi:predicted fused transcriptional regulator/phosphomethylpyrimidine kinase